jgi:hypothetical protein
MGAGLEAESLVLSGAEVSGRCNNPAVEVRQGKQAGCDLMPSASSC